jgi:hypothetical protein
VSERLQQTLQSARGAMDALAQVDILDFDDSAASSAHGVDGVYAEPAIANEPRHDCLSHTEATFLSCDAHWGASGAASHICSVGAILGCGHLVTIYPNYLQCVWSGIVRRSWRHGPAPWAYG